MTLSWVFTHLLGNKETKLNSSLNSWSQVCSGCILLCLTSLDEATVWRFWSTHQYHSSHMWLHKCSQHGKESSPSQWTKNIDKTHHFLRNNVENGNIIMMYCRIEDKIGDIFTKALRKNQFESNKLKLGMVYMHWPNFIQKGIQILF